MEDQGSHDPAVFVQQMVTSWFILSLLALNVGACLTLLAQGRYPWALIYAGAAMIQTGSWWLTK